jgi:chromosome segregation ATPase
MSTRTTRVRFADVPQNVELSEYDVLKEQVADKKAENQVLKQRIEKLQSEFDNFKLLVSEDNPDLSKDRIALLQDLNQTKRDLNACQRQISRLEETIAGRHNESDFSASGSTFRDVSAKQSQEMRDLAAQYDRLQAENLELQLANQKLEEERASKTSETSKLERALRDSEHEKEDLVTKVQNLDALHVKLTRRISRMQTDRQKFTAAETDNQKLRDLVDLQNDKIADLQAKLDVQCAQRDEENAAHEKQLSKVRDESAANERQVSKREDETAALKRQVDKLIQEKAVHEREVSKLLQESAASERQLSKREDETTALQRQVDKLIQEKAAHEEETAGLRRQVDKLIQEKAEHEEETAALRKQVDRLLQDSAASERQLSKREDETAALKRQADKLLQDSAASERQLSKREDETAALKRQIDKLIQEKAAHEREVSKLLQESAASERQISKREDETTALQRQVDKLMQEKAGHEEETAGLRKQVDKLRQEKATHGEETAELRKQVDRLRQEKATHGEETAEYESQVEKLLEDNRRLEEAMQSADIGEKVRTIKKLTAQVKEHQDLAASQGGLQREVAKLTGKIRAADDRNGSLRMQIRTLEAEKEDLRQERDRAISQVQFQERKAALAARSPKTPPRVELGPGDRDRLLEELIQSRRNNDYLVSKLKVLQRGQLAAENSQLRKVNQTLEDKLRELNPEALHQIRTENKFLKSENRNLKHENAAAATLKQENRSLRASLIQLEGENEELSTSLDHSQQIVSEMLGDDADESFDSTDSLEEKLGRAMPQMLETVRGLQDSAKKRRDGDLDSSLQRVSRTLKQLTPTKHSGH